MYFITIQLIELVCCKCWKLKGTFGLFFQGSGEVVVIFNLKTQLFRYTSIQIIKFSLVQAKGKIKKRRWRERHNGNWKLFALDEVCSQFEPLSILELISVQFDNSPHAHKCSLTASHQLNKMISFICVLPAPNPKEKQNQTAEL